MIRTWLFRARVAAVLGLTLAAGLAAPRAAERGQGAPAADAVSAEVRRYFEAVQRNDAASLDSLLAQDYVEVSPLGQVDKRAQVIGFYRTAAKAQTGQVSELGDVAIDDLSVRLYGDVAVAIVRESFKMKVAGEAVARPMRSTLVWHKSGDGWKLVSSHHTTVRPPIAAGSPVAR
jgi:ketosteroid isomerase-like protein